MKTAKKSVLRAAICILALFLLINAGWYVWRSVKYGSYSKGMEKNEIPEWLVPRYKYSDAEKFDYGVKYPDYLSLTGNLSVGMPVTGEDFFTDFLVIWPKVFGGYEYGVSVEVDGEDRQIYIKADGSAVHPEDNWIVERCRDHIDALLNKAKAMWDLE